MSEPAPAWVPSRTHTPTDEVERQLDAAFGADYHRCACGAMIVASETWCYPCATRNRARGPIYGASLAGPSSRPGYPTPTAPITVDWLSATDDLRDAHRRIDALLDQNDALAAKNSDLARQVVSLKGALEAQAAAVRASKAGADSLAVLEANERVVEISRDHETLMATCAQQANRLAACRCGA